LTHERARVVLSLLCAGMLAALPACEGDARRAQPDVAGDAGSVAADGGRSGSAGQAGSAGAVGRDVSVAMGPCDLARAPASGALTLDVDGVTRDYTLVLPSAYDGHTRFPVLFAWHGTGSTGPDFIGSYYGGITDGVAGRALIVAPTGLVDTQGEYAGMTRWQLSDVDGALFDALLAKLESDYCIDTQRVFSTGHSIGGYFSNYLGCSRGDRLRGIAPISGGGPFNTSDCVGQPAVLIGHNPHECAETGPDCPYSVPWATTGWLSTQFWAARDGCMDEGAMPTDAIAGMPPCKSLDGCKASSPVMLCLYDYSDQYAGPHAWPVAWLARTIADYFFALPAE
jgi:polyhydroxybutyrate depolymerase